MTKRSDIVPQDPIPLEDVFDFTAAHDEHSMHVAQFYAFNTEITLQAYGETELVREAFHDACTHCRRYERLFSRTLPHSEISTLNVAGGAAVAVSSDTFELLRASIAYCARSRGLFDITIGSVSRLWDFQSGIMPAPDAIATALQHVDFRFLELDEGPQGYTARLADPKAAVDVGGVAKGFIADRLCELLQTHGLLHFLLNLGGNVVVHGGKPDGKPFSVGIRNPKDAQKVLGSIALESGSVVTSGLSERFFVIDGVRYCHILNPRTGYPVKTDAESATIVAPLSIDCDGFSTTLCALGIEAGLEFARTCPEIAAAVFVDAANQLHMT